MDEYKDIREMLKPRRDIMASERLRSRINATLDAHVKKNHLPVWGWSIGAACAAAAVMLLIFLPSGLSAREILTQAVTLLRENREIEMVVEVRTRPMENFKYIKLDEDFVRHQINVSSSGDSIMCWRIDKGGRTAIGDNSKIYNWIDELKIGWSSTGGDASEQLGYMATLLSPGTILEAELQHCIEVPESEYKVIRNKDEIILTVHMQPDGDFSNPYKLNGSIAESENIREYVFDAASKQLKSASVSVVNGRRSTQVLGISSISYGHADASLYALPDDIDFIDVASTRMAGLSVSNPTEAASVILKALEAWNTSILEATIHANILDAVYKDNLKGAVLVRVGESFISGNESNTYVPYTLKLADGSVKSHNLVMQKNRHGCWIVVGGL